MQSERTSAGRMSLPPMGQGLAVIATLAAMALLTLATIGLYLAALHVRSHRVAVERVDDQVAVARQQVRALQDELAFRSRFTQLERWRTPLGLEAAGLGQRATDPRELAALRPGRLQAIADRLPKVDAKPGKASYTPQARHQMDDLIGQVAG